MGSRQELSVTAWTVTQLLTALVQGDSHAASRLLPLV
jgi:hypothetical protein